VNTPAVSRFSAKKTRPDILSPKFAAVRRLFKAATAMSEHVVVVPINTDDNVFMRRTAKKSASNMTALPAANTNFVLPHGVLRVGEDIFEAGRRVLAVQMGLTALSWRRIAHFGDHCYQCSIVVARKVELDPAEIAWATVDENDLVPVTLRYPPSFPASELLSQLASGVTPLISGFGIALWLATYMHMT